MHYALAQQINVVCYGKTKDMFLGDGLFSVEQNLIY